MLIRFRVSGYRGFDRPIEIDFTDKKNYQFGKECVRGDFLDKVIIIGGNGAGKTNFGYALMDIVSTLTGFSKDIGQCELACFINGDTQDGCARFHYEFTFGGSYGTYEYAKDRLDGIVSEKFVLDRVTVFDYKVGELPDGKFQLERINAQRIDIGTVDGSKSLLRKIIEETYQDKYSFIRSMSDFVSHMLYYRAMWKKDEHIGLMDHDDDIDQFIVEGGYLEELKQFLREVGTENEAIGISGRQLVIRTRTKDLPFLESASRGTMILCRLFCWIMRCRDKNALIYFDDFDDMFHYKPAENAMKAIISHNKGQCIFVTHNTGLISNDFLRPDCCFILESGELSSLASRTSKDIRKGHNLEKMLRGGEFDRSLEKPVE